MNEKFFQYTNQLVNESSPYLLQHAHNPVNWHPWNERTLQKAKEENKLIIISIGYAACHWCHVMEHESFEDEEVAEVMNENFICIKVDREERPDVDQVYMDAVHQVGGRGGWPLNCFALSDGRPFWGATYFPKDQWTNVLLQIVNLYKTQKSRLIEQASDIATGISQNEFLQPDETFSIGRELPDEMVELFSTRFDKKEGGTKGAPKFPMPNNYLFLLRYYVRTKKVEILAHVELTLRKMASGGIYDQIGGGFSRYSVDDRWHIPHFEKMLYDNAQLVSIYSEAYQLTKNDFYKQVIVETLGFIKRELTDYNGGFYSSLDADSDREEGKFYVWTKEEIESLAGKNAEIVKDYFGIDKEALWEDSANVLVKAMTIQDLALKFKKPEDEIENIISGCKTNLLQKRSERTRPGLDDKILTSWNALMVKGYVDAFKSTGNADYLDTAIRNGEFLLNKLKKPDGSLHHNFKKGKSTINGFLEDYAFVIAAFISLYQATFNERWLLEARILMEYVIQHFSHSESNLFYFTSDENTDLFARKLDVTDNVIPSPNSSIAHSLYLLGLYFEHPDYLERARKMLASVEENMKKYPSAFSNWGILTLNMVNPYYTIVICGSQALEFARQFSLLYLPDTLLAVSIVESDLPIFQNRFLKDKTLIFVCSEDGCQMPVETIEETMKLINR
jgi:uncharacterized protein YyaL (SSP411 family)